MKKEPSAKQLVILDTDAVRLKQLLLDPGSGNNQYCKALKEEVYKARIVSRSELNDDVVIMHSTVVIRDLDTKETYEYTLVYPREADIETSKISILAPIGTALIGYKKGDEIHWQVPGGVRRLKIASVVQPFPSRGSE